MYLLKMSPVVELSDYDHEGRHFKFAAPILLWYDRFQKLISDNTDAARKHRKEIFGAGELKETPDLYSDYGFFKEYRLTESEYQGLDLHEQARMRAHFILNNIVEIRSAHMRIMEDRIKRRTEGSNRGG